MLGKTETALITGAAGFVGSNVVRYFIEKTDLNLILIDSFNHKGDSLRLQDLKSDRVKIYTHDLSNLFSDRSIDHMGPVDYILNIASESHVDRSITDPVPFVKNNVALALTIGELARIVKPKMLLQMSTDECFGPALDGYRHKEWDGHRPSNPYSASKCAQDDILFSYWRCYNVPVVRTRTMNIFGPRQDGEKFIPMLISKIHKAEEVIIHGSPGMIGSRMYLHVYNLADAWAWLMQNHKPTLYKDDHTIEQQYDAFNITGLEEVNNLELAMMVAKILNKPLKYKLVDFHSARPGHDRRYALDGTKLKELGWSHPYSFHETIEKTVWWTTENKEWML